MDIHAFFSVASTEITMHDLTVWGYFLDYGKWRMEIQKTIVSDKNMKGRNEAYYYKSLNEVKN